MTSKIVVNNIESDSGISSVTFTSDIELGTKNLKGHNLESTGIVTAVSFTGSGANLTSIPAGNLTGTLPALDGSALTGVGVGTDGSINTSGIITATTFVPTVGQLSHRNIVVNGDMTIAQRGSTSTSQGYHTIDRIYQLYSGTDEAPTFAQADVTSGGAFDAGFRKCLKITNGNQTSGAGAGDRVRFEYRIEAQHLANCGWNYKSTSSYITLSFWVKSSVAQNFYARLYSADGTPQAYTFETGALTANTWTKVTKIIPGNSNIQFDNNNAYGMIMSFAQYAGSDYTDAGNTMNTWAAYSGSSRYPTNTSTWYTTNDATWEFTGLQFEVGSAATPFEHLSFAENKRRCGRYCQRSRFSSFAQVGTPGTYYFSRAKVPLTVPMRAAVTGTIKQATWLSNRYFAYKTWSSQTNVTTLTSEAFASSHMGGSSATLDPHSKTDVNSVDCSLTVASGSSNSPLPANGPGSNNVYPIEIYDCLLEAEL